MMRFQNNGSLDQSFGTEGKVVTVFDSVNSNISKILIQNDNKITALGSTYAKYGEDGTFALARYSPDGVIDNSFGNNGTQITDLGGNARGNSGLLQSNGKIVIAGHVFFNELLEADFALARYYGDAPIVSLAKNIKVEEGNIGYTPAAFHVELNNVSSAQVKVKYRTINGSAIAGKDYVADSGFVFIKPGKIMKTITVAVIGNNIQEPDKNFFLQIGEPKNALLGAFTKAACTIKNDDAVAAANNNDKAIAKNIKLSPNPAKDVLQLQGLDANSNSVVSIINLEGSAEYTTTVSNSSSCSVHVAHLKSGMYYLRIQQQGKIVTLVFVKE